MDIRYPKRSGPNKKNDPAGQTHFKKLMAWIFVWFILEIFGPEKGGRSGKEKNSREKIVWLGSVYIYIYALGHVKPPIESPKSCEFDEDDETVPLISIYMKSRSV